MDKKRAEQDRLNSLIYYHLILDMAHRKTLAIYLANDVNLLQNELNSAGKAGIVVEIARVRNRAFELATIASAANLPIIRDNFKNLIEQSHTIEKTLAAPAPVPAPAPAPAPVLFSVKASHKLDDKYYKYNEKMMFKSKLTEEELVKIASKAHDLAKEANVHFMYKMNQKFLGVMTEATCAYNRLVAKRLAP